MPLRSHLILVGLPGAGKTAVGERAAAVLGVPFLDFDREIERREGKSVAAIFAGEGEGRFRELERALTTELAGREPMVLSPGGGWITSPGVAVLLRPPARVVYLKVSPGAALARMGAEHAARPLLRGPDPLAALRALLRSREALYEQADHVIDTELIDMQSVTRAVVALASLSRTE